jgi:hypothetical protein
MKVSAPEDITSRWMIDYHGGYLVLKPGITFQKTGFKKYYNILTAPISDPVTNQRYWYTRCIKNQTVLPRNIRKLNMLTMGNRYVFNRSETLDGTNTDYLKQLADEKKDRFGRDDDVDALRSIPGVRAVTRDISNFPKILAAFPELKNILILSTDGKIGSTTLVSMSIPNIMDHKMSQEDITNRDELLKETDELDNLHYGKEGGNCIKFSSDFNCVFYVLGVVKGNIQITRITHSHKPTHKVCLWKLPKEFVLLYSIHLPHLKAFIDKLDDHLFLPDILINPYIARKTIVLVQKPPVLVPRDVPEEFQSASAGEEFQSASEGEEVQSARPSTHDVYRRLGFDPPSNPPLTLWDGDGSVPLPNFSGFRPPPSPRHFFKP